MGRVDDLYTMAQPPMRHPRMPRAERAKQFMAFAALRGYADLLQEREELVEARFEAEERGEAWTEDTDGLPEDGWPPEETDRNEG